MADSSTISHKNLPTESGVLRQSLTAMALHKINAAPPSFAYLFGEPVRSKSLQPNYTEFTLLPFPEPTS
ncbi:hypothetical protein BofuT4_uP060220.1 [Botrytis cinerea T4]|uniref:Uncharacterized protein n=1 Tax=Botryotinia fuckeliana (strain T4) TaxID=999810 RepID=G2XUD3_BOTF4|nr:hypothetical protein BofuT4_uP060220.1 [Botrytis cinerea T4]